ncbi:MAG: hypothetical protein OXI22_05675 [Defluviicoccus sp.]|nr:hypothetical protein [Defluviicoccus sp.]MDE0383354.1 hypothetical protein [Defluviicoccus sp.]
MTVRLHYNPDCPVCARRAQRTARLDWLGRVELSTDDSPLGPVPPGEIVVVDGNNGRAFAGIRATRKLCLQVPLLFPYGLALYLLPAR